MNYTKNIVYLITSTPDLVSLVDTTASATSSVTAFATSFHNTIMAAAMAGSGDMHGIDTLPAFVAWSEASLRETLVELKDAKKVDRELFREFLVKLRKELDPIFKNDHMTVLMNEHQKDGIAPEAKAALGRQVAELLTTLGATKEVMTYTEYFEAAFRELDVICAQDKVGAFGRSNRAKRAKRPDVLFRDAAALSKAVPDADGNTAASGGDLGIPGAFDGLKLLILSQYIELTETLLRPIRRDLEEKGFTVIIHCGDATDTKLKDLLVNVNQVWVIGTSTAVLTDAQIELLVDEWKSGTGFYVFGDNEPYYVDTNRLLKAMGLPQMSGNYHACKYLTPYNAATGKGFHDCLVTTGIDKRLYEGQTIAEFEKDDVLRTECKVVFNNTGGGISVIMRQAKNGCGQVIIDGAFTKLYCKYDATGSKWLVVNSACFLAADFSAPVVVEPEGEEKVIELDLTGAPKPTCDILFDEMPCALLAHTLGDPEENTGDFTLDDPLRFGFGNMNIFSGQLTGLEVSKQMLARGENPFTRKDVFAVVPLVDLSIVGNRDIVYKLLCDVYMGGLSLGSAVWLLHFAVCDTHLGVDGCEHPEAWQYSIDQMLDNCKSTPTFGGEGETVPLIVAMETYAALGEMERLSKSFSTVCLMARHLHARSRAVPGELIKWCSQSLLKAIVSVILAKAKDGTKKAFDLAFEELCYETKYKIPIMGSQHVVSEGTVIDWLFEGDDMLKIYGRLVGALGVERLLSDDQMMGALHELHMTSARELNQWRVDAALTAMCLKPVFGAVWDGADVDGVTALGRVFDGLMILDDTHMGAFVPFVTCLGPSVYGDMSCGTVFGDPTLEVTAAYADRVKTTRNKHFQHVYGADANGYPTKTSGCYNLNRAVQVVMTRWAHAAETEITEEQKQEVADYLLRESKGNFYVPKIAIFIAMALVSYIECRKAGSVEPTHREDGTIYVQFEERMRVEKAFINSGKCAEVMAATKAAHDALFGDA